jgi:UDPglucose 6-dehydrogenase
LPKKKLYNILRRCYDTTKLSRVLAEINRRKVASKHVVIVCTVFPGYIANIGRYLLQDCPGTTLSYNPEFIAQGDIVNGFFKCDMVLIGEGSKEAGDKLEEIYRATVNSSPTYCRMAPESAEITKLGVNCFVTTKISFANMVGDIANRTPGANAREILMAIGADSRVGRKYLMPGWGYGGPCFPRDNRALGTYAESVGIEPKISIATDEYNKYHTQRMLEDYLAEGKDSYTFTYVAYKDNCEVPIIEESQKLVVARGLAKAGKKVLIQDIQPIVDAVKAEYGRIFEYEIVPPASALKK